MFHEDCASAELTYTAEHGRSLFYKITDIKRDLPVSNLQIERELSTLQDRDTNSNA